MKHSIIKNLRTFEKLSREEIFENRKIKFLKIGRDQGFGKSSNLNESSLSYDETKYQKIVSHLKSNKLVYLGISVVILVSIVSLIY